MRHSMAASHGYPPFTLVTGQLPILAADVNVEVELPGEDATPYEEQEYVQKMVKTLQSIRDIARLRLTDLEIKLRERMLKNEASTENMHTMFHFKVGDLVLRRAKNIGKTKARAQGPYRVMKITGRYG